MLWVHGRTRFAQARAELGMTDRTGGPSSANYVHRERPENFEEDEEQLSDGEDARILDAREGTSVMMMRMNEFHAKTGFWKNVTASCRSAGEGCNRYAGSTTTCAPPL